jgi:hypothetical protein
MQLVRDLIPGWGLLRTRTAEPFRSPAKEIFMRCLLYALSSFAFVLGGCAAEDDQFSAEPSEAEEGTAVAQPEEGAAVAQPEEGATVAQPEEGAAVAQPTYALAPSTQNLAAGKPASQSSTDFGGIASRAVDNNTNGNWGGNSVTHTALQAQPWWQVDLGAAYVLGRVILYNRTDCCGERLANFDIFVSNDGASWTRAATYSGIAPARSALSLSASGRFVRVQLQGTNYLSLAEVQVFPAQNLAAGKPASQSSTDFGGVASRAVDDNTNGNWGGNSVTHTALQAQPWWQVDLGAAYALGQVVLYNRTDCCGERLANFDILVSNNGTSWTRAATYSGIAPARSALSLNASGRFVRVQLRGTNYLSLAEVQVFPPQNLAAGKPASQSSTENGGIASRAVDDDTNGNWFAGSVTHTALQAQPWWQVDLGAVYALGQVVLYNRTDCCGERLANFDIFVSNDGVSWTRAATASGIAPARSAHFVRASGRFVRVQLRGTNYLSLAEVQVFPAQNLAAGKPTSQSSTENGGIASRAVDDNTSGNWFGGSVTHTTLQAQPWWQVDLGAASALGQVVLYNRTDCCGERLANFDIFVSNNGAAWRRAATYSGIAPARVALSLNGAGRFVRVQLQGTNYLSLAEVQVFPPQN